MVSVRHTGAGESDKSLLPGHGDHSQSHSATDPDTVLEVLNRGSTPLLGSEAVSAVLKC